MRLFAAVWPPPALIEGLRRLDRPARPGLRWTTGEQWHVTLRFYGSVEPPELAEITRALGQAASRVPAPLVTSGPRPVALSRHVWCLPVEGLSGLAGAIGTAERRPFRGHVTLARARTPGRGQLSGLPAPELIETWTVDELCLVKSDLHREGARYHVLNRWRLEGGGA